MTSAPSTLDITSTMPIAKLAKPLAVPKPNLTKFNLDYGRLLTDDYVHKKLLTLKYTGKGYNFTLNAKGTLDLKLGADKKETPVTSSEVKLTTNIEGRSIETKFDSKGVIRLCGTIGSYNIVRPLFFTAKLKTNNSFNRLSGYLCAEYQGAQSNIWTRLDLKNGNVPLLNEKMIFRINQFQLGYAAKLNLKANTLARYNFFAAYNERDFSVVAEHVSRNQTKPEIGKLIVAATLRRGGNDFVMKTSYRPYKAEQLRLKLGTVYNINRDTVLRAKINNNAKLTLGSRMRYNSNLSIVAGTQINLLNPSTYPTGRTVPVPLGITVEFNHV
jgi:hypothetical protein